MKKLLCLFCAVCLLFLCACEHTNNNGKASLHSNADNYNEDAYKPDADIDDDDNTNEFNTQNTDNTALSDALIENVGEMMDSFESLYVYAFSAFDAAEMYLKTNNQNNIGNVLSVFSNCSSRIKIIKTPEISLTSEHIASLSDVKLTLADLESVIETFLAIKDSYLLVIENLSFYFDDVAFFREDIEMHAKIHRSIAECEVRYDFLSCCYMLSDCTGANAFFDSFHARYKNLGLKMSGFISDKLTIEALAEKELDKIEYLLDTLSKFVGDRRGKLFEQRDQIKQDYIDSGMTEQQAEARLSELERAYK